FSQLKNPYADIVLRTGLTDWRWVHKTLFLSSRWQIGFQFATHIGWNFNRLVGHSRNDAATHGSDCPISKRLNVSFRKPIRCRAPSTFHGSRGRKVQPGNVPRFQESEAVRTRRTSHTSQFNLNPKHVFKDNRAVVNTLGSHTWPTNFSPIHF